MIKTKLKLIVMLAAMSIITVGGGNTFTAYGDNISGKEAVIVNQEDVEEESVEEIKNYGATAPLLVSCNIIGEIKAGNTVKVPVYLYGVRNKGDIEYCDIKLKYNTNVFEDVTIEAGELCSLKECLRSKVDEKNQKIVISFLGYDSEGNEEPLERDGILANITLKVKDDYDGTEPTEITAYDDIMYMNSSESDYKGYLAKSNFPLPASVKVSVEEDGNPECINPSFLITNTSGKPLDLKYIVIEYYYTSEAKGVDDIFECTYAGTIDGEIQDLTSKVRGSKYNYSYSGAYDNTDSAMHLSLSGGKLEDGQSMVIKTKITKKDNKSYYKHSNDYSYRNPSGVCVYIDDTPVFGISPSDYYVGRVTVYGEANSGYEWRSSIKDESIAEIIKKPYIADEITGELVSSKEPNEFIIKGLKKGSTEVTFNYVDPVKGEIVKKQTYSVKVDANLKVTVTEKEEEVPLKNKDLLLQVEENDNTPSNQINPKISLKNNSEKELDLTNVKLKYYYTSDGDQEEAFDCYYAGTTNGTYQNLTSNLEGKIIKLADNEKIENADKCLEITFNGGTLEANQEMSMNVNLHKSDWSSYDRTNDYSYNNADNICVFLNDELVPGLNPQEPEQEGTGEEEKPPVENPDNKEEDKPQVTEPEKSEEEKPEIPDEDKEAANNVTLDVITKGQLRANGNADVEIKMSDLKKSIQGYTLQLLYDEDLYEYVDTTAGDITPNSKKTFSTNCVNGKVCLMFAPFTQESPETIDKDGVLATIHFKVKKNGSDSEFENALKLVDNKDKCLFYAVDESELNINSNFSIAPDMVDKEKAKNINLDISAYGNAEIGEDVNVEINVSEVRKPIEGFTLQLQYDEDLYEYEKTVLGINIINNEKLFSVKNKDGKVCLFFAYDPENPDTAINKDFTLANIHFRIKKRANYDDFEKAIQLVEDKDKCFFCADDRSELNINYKFVNNVYERCY